jgi:hypothetical protein
VLTSTVLLLRTCSSFAAVNEFPADITKYVVTDYGAVPDDAGDDTVAIQAAFDDGRETGHAPDYYHPRPKMVFFPAGTYIVSDTLQPIGIAFTIRGQGAGATVIRLADNAPGFGDPADPKPVYRTQGGNYSFRMHVWDLTINTGKGNPGAVGIDFIANNSGAVRDVEIRSGDGHGVAGLSMTRQWPGPCTVRNVTVDGFDYGVSVAHSEFGQTYENLTVTNQNVAGMKNAWNIVSMRGFTSVNAVPALLNTGSPAMAVILDGNLQGGSSSGTAIANEGRVYLRNVTASGYGTLLDDDGTAVPGPSASEYVSGPVQSLFASPQASLGLPVEDTPEFHDNDPANWAALTSPGWYGDNRTWQDTINSGKSTIYWPAGVYLAAQRTYTVPATVRKIAAFGSVINKPSGSQWAVKLQVTEPSAEALIVEQVGYGVVVEHACPRTVVMKNGIYSYTGLPGAGKVFMEDVQTDNLVLDQGQTVWMRGLNTEGDNLHVRNVGSTLWVLGVKTEGKGTLFETTAGGVTELLGGLLYPTASFGASDPPAFVIEEASASLIYGLSEYVSNGAYIVQVRETRGGATKEYLTADMPHPRINRYSMPLFTGYGEAPTGQAARPAISPAGGEFQDLVTVTLTTTTSGAEIRYTTDGTVPTATSGTLYSAPFDLAATSTVIAVAYKSGMLDSRLASASFIVMTANDHDGDGVPDWQDADDDGDGLPDADELALGTDPLDADSDDDGMFDGAEVAAGFDPLVADQDGNGVRDGLDDWDGDGIDNQTELAAGLPAGTVPLPGGGEEDGFLGFSCGAGEGGPGAALALLVLTAAAILPKCLVARGRFLATMRRRPVAGQETACQQAGSSGPVSPGAKG